MLRIIPLATALYIFSAHVMAHDCKNVNLDSSDKWDTKAQYMMLMKNDKDRKTVVSSSKVDRDTIRFNWGTESVLDVNANDKIKVNLVLPNGKSSTYKDHTIVKICKQKIRFKDKDKD